MEPATGQTAAIIPRRFRSRVSPLRAGVLGVLLTAIAVYLAFSKQLPWQHPFEFKAVFQTSNNIQLNSPVRIAGVNVGKVVKIERQPGSDAAAVTIAMEDKGLPLHKDATMKIRSRIFLEGNFFIELQPGTPGSPDVGDGDTLPVTRTSTPVQLDQILTALQSNDRAALQDVLKGLGDAYMRKPTPAEDAKQDPDVRGLSAAQALNKTLDYSPDALKGAAQVNNALLGTQKGDLAKLIAGLQKVTAALGRNEELLKDWVTNFNSFTSIFAAEEANLSRSVQLLGPTVEHAHAALTNLDAALPQLSGFARDIIPGVKETPATIEAVKPWIAETRKLVSRSEGGAFLRSLRPAASSLAMVTDSSVDLFEQVNRTSRCFADVILPAGDVVLQDGDLTSGVASYKEFWYTMVAFAGESQNFDGNGAYVRTATGGGDKLIQTGKISGTSERLSGKALSTPLGTRPPRPAKQPAYKLDFPCYKNAKPDLNGPAASAGPGDQTRSFAGKHARGTLEGISR